MDGDGIMLTWKDQEAYERHTNETKNKNDEVAITTNKSSERLNEIMNHQKQFMNKIENIPRKNLYDRLD